jgi:hypothetical protein
MHIAEVINKLIREYQSGNAPVDSHIDAVIVREHVLPVWRDMGGCYALSAKWRSHILRVG